jgi:hypothetical protein
MWAGRLFDNRPFLLQPRSLYNDPLLFVIPSAAEGSAVPRTLLGNIFERSAAQCLYAPVPFHSVTS